MAACLQTSPLLAGEETQAWAPPARPPVAGASVNADQGARDALAQVARMWFKAEWQNYAATFVTPDGRIVDNANGNVSHSEGQGYGLLLAVYAEDSERFDKIWRWTEAHMMVRPDHLLSWRWDPQKGAITDPNNATDGDILVAWALARAAQKFDRPDYRASAALIADAIGATLIKTSDRGPILLPAASGFTHDDQPDGPVVNLSYWVFPAFPTLKQLAPAYDWDALSANGLKLLSAARFGPLRLPPDWLSLGGPAPAPAEKFPTQFGYNAIRIPLYLAWDGAPSARRALSGFVSGAAPAAPAPMSSTSIRDRRNRRSTAPAIAWCWRWRAASRSICRSTKASSRLGTRSTTRTRCVCCRLQRFRKGSRNVFEASPRHNRDAGACGHGRPLARRQFE